MTNPLNGQRPQMSPSLRRIRGEAGRRQKPVSRAFFLVSVAITAACILGILWLVIGNVPVGAFGTGPRIVLVILLAIFVVASLATTEIIPWQSRSWSDWHQPKVMGTLVYLLLGAVSFVSGIGAVFNRPSAEQATLLAAKATGEANREDTAALRNGLDRLTSAVGAGVPSLIKQKISRVWGEEGCAVTYRFEFADRALKIKSLKSPGIKDYNPEYTVMADHNDIAPSGERTSTLETVEAKGYWPGFGVQFRYVTNGSSERLIWDHRKMSTQALELVRC